VTLAGGALTVTGSLTLTNGLLTTSSANPLVLANSLSVPPAGSAQSYVSGPLSITFQVSSATSRTFAIGASALPSYIPFSAKPKPDYASKGELYEDGYIRYPSPPIKGVPTDAPAWQHSAALVDGLYPPPTPLEQNPAWQEINRRLNATLQFNIVPPADYAENRHDDGERLSRTWSTCSAASVLVPTCSVPPASGRRPHAVPRQGCRQRLSQPAALPTFAWRNLGSVIEGGCGWYPSRGPASASHGQELDGLGRESAVTCLACGRLQACPPATTASSDSGASAPIKRLCPVRSKSPGSPRCLRA
jgi:hypothetical protein